ncbi:hypothetical protein [Actinokineospora sp. NPDC004072]
MSETPTPPLLTGLTPLEDAVVAAAFQGTPVVAASDVGVKHILAAYMASAT